MPQKPVIFKEEVKKVSSKPIVQPKPTENVKKPVPFKKQIDMNEDLDAMMIAQMLEEDESRILAEKIQNEMYG